MDARLRKIIRDGVIGRVIALLIVAAALPYGNAVAGTMIVATGGGAISADTTSAAGGSGAWTALTGPTYLEKVKADLLAGTVILTAPAGFEFNTASPVTVQLTAGDSNANLNINKTAVGGIVATAMVTATTITWNIISQSNGQVMDQVTWLGIQVRPTAGAPLATGNIVPSGTSGIGNFAASAGTLTEVPGAANKLAFVQQPSNAVGGTAISPAITVAIQDQFGNTVTSNTSTVTLAIGTNPSGGTLSGTASVAAAGGVATFSTLSIDKVGTGYTLVASDGALTGATSSAFNITPGMVSAVVSTVAASPTSVTANGTTISTITVTLKDGLGNPVPGKTVMLTAGSGSSIISVASGPSNASGIVTFMVTDTVAQAVTYTAKDTTDNITINQTATVTFTAVIAVVSSFNAFESATTAGAITGVIHTKIAGSAFGLDVVAISGGAQSAGFTNAVKVELLGNIVTGIALDAQNCPSSFTVLQTVTPNPTINTGRSTVNFAAVADAWKDVRVRISYPATGSTTAVSCSTDNFAIRPNSLSVSITDSNWQAAGTAHTLNNSVATGGNVHKAAQPFTIRATAYNAAAAMTGNYAGTPSAQPIACTLPTPTCINGTLTLGAWTAAGGTVTSTTATYSEAGSFNLTLQDTTFASVDTADGTPATCAGYYVCSAATLVGRFVPDHFVLTTNNVPNLKTFNNTACATRSFTYIGQPFGYVTAPQVLVTAQNSANVTTANYTSNLWKLATAAGAQDCTTNPDICMLTSGNITQTYTYTTSTGALPNWDSTQATMTTPAIVAGSNGTGTVTSASTDLLAFKRSITTPLTLFTASITLTDSVKDTSETGNCGVANCDITTLAPAAFNPVAFDAGNEFRYGRLKLGNAHGSELLKLPIPIQTQYWNGTSFVTNTADNCTRLVTNNNIKLTTPPAGVSAAVGGAFASGVGSLTLSPPTTAAKVAVDLCVDLGTDPVGGTVCAATTSANLPYLQGLWAPGTSYNNDTGARATFGVYKGAKGFIYLRENY